MKDQDNNRILWADTSVRSRMELLRTMMASAEQRMEQDALRLQRASAYFNAACKSMNDITAQRYSDAMGVEGENVDA